ncbi:hypothetical protein LX36DRAFT_714500 [Colletotrichum falcatum]|nr:hypothetical protein LX36DRAFT_714500 [Colletotrichum falcatum]
MNSQTPSSGKAQAVAALRNPDLPVKEVLGHVESQILTKVPFDDNTIIVQIATLVNLRGRIITAAHHIKAACDNGQSVRRVAFVLYGGTHLYEHYGGDGGMDKFAPFFTGHGPERYPGSALVMMDVAKSEDRGFYLKIKQFGAVTFCTEKKAGDSTMSMADHYIEFFLTYLASHNQMPGIPGLFLNIPGKVSAIRHRILKFPIEETQSPEAVIYALGQLFIYTAAASVHDFLDTGHTGMSIGEATGKVLASNRDHVMDVIIRMIQED